MYKGSGGGVRLVVGAKLVVCVWLIDSGWFWWLLVAAIRIVFASISIVSFLHQSL